MNKTLSRVSILTFSLLLLLLLLRIGWQVEINNDDRNCNLESIQLKLLRTFQHTEEQTVPKEVIRV